VKVLFRCVSALFVFVWVWASVSAAKAQGAVYGEIGATNYGYTVNNGGLISSTDRFGGTFGGFYNFPIQSRLTAGIDGHVGFGLHSKTGVKGLASVRFGFVPHRNPLRPYVEIGGGAVSTHLPSETITSGALELGFGLDVRVSPKLDWRAVELESAAGGGNHSAGSASLSTGVVYHFGAARSRQT